MTIDLSNLFEKMLKETELTSGAPVGEINQLQRQVEKLSKEIKELHQKGSKPNRNNIKGSSLLDKPMSIQEKRVLGQNIHGLPPDCLRGIWEIVSKAIPMQNHSNEELEFDLNNLPNRVLRELERYVKSKLSLQTKSAPKKKKSPSPVNIAPLPTSV